MKLFKRNFSFFLFFLLWGYAGILANSGIIGLYPSNSQKQVSNHLEGANRTFQFERATKGIRHFFSIQAQIRNVDESDFELESDYSSSEGRASAFDFLPQYFCFFNDLIFRSVFRFNPFAVKALYLWNCVIRI